MDLIVLQLESRGMSERLLLVFYFLGMVGCRLSFGFAALIRGDVGGVRNPAPQAPTAPRLHVGISAG